MWRVGSADALDFWERRLADEGIATERDETTLRFADHEGLDHELAIVDTTDPPLVGESPEIPAELRAAGARRCARVPHRRVVRAWGSSPIGSGSWTPVPTGATRCTGRVAVAGTPSTRRRRRSGASARGCVQHVAWGCDPADIEAWAEVAAAIDPKATPIIDRHFFRSVYFTEPGGVLFEIAEFGGPGFAVDEPDLARMGDTLTLPPWLEERRKLYEFTLTPVPSTDALRAGTLARPRVGS